jgi:hypothetical protein
MTSMRFRVSCTLMLLLASISAAHAYIDPGTGSMVLQMALAGIAGALFYFRQMRLAAVDWFRRVVLRREPDADSKPSTSETIS